MTRYKVLEFPVDDQFSAEVVERRLNELGEHGWTSEGQPQKVNKKGVEVLIYTMTREVASLPAESNGL